MYWTTLEISAPRCALMCYPSSNITYCIACLLCIGVILLNKFNQSINQSRSMYCRSLLGGRYIAAMFVVVEVYFSGSHF